MRDRFEDSLTLNELARRYFVGRQFHNSLFYIKGDYDTLLGFIRWLYKNYRWAYFKLSFW